MKRHVLATSVVAFASVYAHAAEPAPQASPPPTTAPRSLPDALPPPPPASPPAEKAWKGFLLVSDDGHNRVRIGGQLQVDAWGFFEEGDADALKNEVRIRRARTTVRATVAKHHNLRLLVDFADARLQLLDAVVELAYLPELTLRVGKEKSPVSFDRLQSSTAWHFLEQSPTTQLAPNRDLGLQLVGKIANGLVDYQLGLWDGAPDGQSIEQDVDDGFDFAGRVTLRPFVSTGIPALAGLHLGVGASHGDVTGTPTTPQLGSARTSGRATWFRYASGSDLATTAIADGARTRIGGHLLWLFGPLTVFGEIVSSSQRVRLADVTADVSNTAWVAQATLLLTGDEASWRGVIPEHEFDLFDGRGMGGLELAVRWSELHIDDSAFERGLASASSSASAARALTIGLNWYLNSAVKLQLDFERTTFDDGATTGDRPEELLLGARVQLLY